MKDLRMQTLCLFIILFLSFSNVKAIVNDRVTRVFNMEGPNVKQVTSIEFVNDGKQDIDSYILLVPSQHIDNLVQIEAKAKGVALSTTKYESSEIPSTHVGFKVQLDAPLKPGKTAKISVTEEYINRKKPFPSKMKITDTPKVRVIDDAYYQTLYLTKKMKSTFEAGSSAALLKVTEIDSGEVRGRSVRYGTYRDIEPLKSHPVYIHAGYDDPLPVFTEVKRSVTLSHWKSISIDEEYRLTNRIATLEGEFGRLDYNPWKIKYSINNLDCELPKLTSDLYYTDEIGNITTSHAFRGNNSVHFTIEPRFPLMGGWKTYWKQGYNLPKEEYITQEGSSDSYTFKINLSHPYNDIVAENFSLSIVLPEGATDIDLQLPFEVDSVERSTVYKYLDLRGRTNITLKRRNVMEKYHDKFITVTYKLSAFDIYLKPVIL